MHDRAKDVSVLRRDLLSITGNYKEAIVLNQLLYWTKRVKDFSKWMKEEKERIGKEENNEPALCYGWIYKSADELSDEVMISQSRMTISRILLRLLNKGFISRRRNPRHKVDKIMQYRVDVNVINLTLNKNGYENVKFFADDNDKYEFFEYGEEEKKKNITDKNDNAQYHSDTEHADSSEGQYHGDIDDGKSNINMSHSDVFQYQNETSQYQNDTAIPEITSENTEENTSKKKEKYKKEKVGNETYEKFLEIENLYERMEKSKLVSDKSLKHIEKMAYIIYKHYPKQEQGHAAMKSIQRVLSKRICEFDELLEHTIAYSDCRGKAVVDIKFTPMPSTWYNQRRFEDDNKVGWISSSPLIASFDGLPVEHDVKWAYEDAKMIIFDLYHHSVEKKGIQYSDEEVASPEEVDELQKMTEELFNPARNDV